MCIHLCFSGVPARCVRPVGSAHYQNGGRPQTHGKREDEKVEYIISWIILVSSCSTSEQRSGASTHHPLPRFLRIFKKSFCSACSPSPAVILITRQESLEVRNDPFVFNVLLWSRRIEGGRGEKQFCSKCSISRNLQVTFVIP